jgi:hypothetical protein
MCGEQVNGTNMPDAGAQLRKKWLTPLRIGMSMDSMIDPSIDSSSSMARNI